MNRAEIFSFIDIGQFICIDRRSLEKYPGIIRNTIIRPDAKLQIDYIDIDFIEIYEVEVTLYFYYENYDKLSLDKAWTSFQYDFVDKKLHLPMEYKKYEIRGLYMKALSKGEIKVNDSFEEFDKWVKKKMREEAEFYGED